MSSDVEINGTSASEWDSFVCDSPRGHLLQNSRWGKLKSAFGWESSLVTVRRRGVLTAGALVLFRGLPALGKFCPIVIGYVPKGPLLDYQDEDALQSLVGGLDQLCRRRRAAWVTIEPDESQSGELDRKLLAAGFQRSKHAIQPQSTILLDLTPGPEECLARMSAKTRYNIRLSDRRGIRVVTGAEADIRKFYSLAVITGQRDGFSIHSLEYYEEAYRLCRDIDAVQLLMAYFQEKLLAGLMVFALGGKSWYLYGASSDEERQRMPNHALQWAALNWAWSKGCHTYDLWGIPPQAPLLEGSEPSQLRSLTDDPPRGSLWGVYRFKRGFGGETIRFIGGYDRVYFPAIFWLYDNFVSRRHPQD